MRLLKKALLILKTEGLGSLAQHTCVLLLSLVYAQYECKTYTASMTVLYRQTVDTTGFELKVIDLKVADSLPLEYDDIRDYHPRVQKALECGATALAYYQGERLACFCFMATTPKAKKAVCPVHYYNDNVAIMGMGYTVPEHRGRGLMQALMVELFNHQFVSGFKKFSNIIGVDNTHCVHSAENFRAVQADAPVIGKGIYRRVLWFHLWEKIE